MIRHAKTNILRGLASIHLSLFDSPGNPPAQFWHVPANGYPQVRHEMLAMIPHAWERIRLLALVELQHAMDFVPREYSQRFYGRENAHHLYQSFQSALL